MSPFSFFLRLGLAKTLGSDPYCIEYVPAPYPLSQFQVTRTGRSSLQTESTFEGAPNHLRKDIFLDRLQRGLPLLRLRMTGHSQAKNRALSIFFDDRHPSFLIKLRMKTNLLSLAYRQLMDSPILPPSSVARGGDSKLMTESYPFAHPVPDPEDARN